VVSVAAGTTRQPLTFWPAHRGENSPLPGASAFARSGSNTAEARGKAGAAAFIGPSSATNRFAMARAGLPVNTFVTAVC
jgi:hypothetical protein